MADNEPDFESSQTKLQRARVELEEARAVQKLEANNRTVTAHTKLQEARAELEEARAAAKLEAATRAENVQIKLEEARRAQHLQIELEEARAKLEQRVQAELEKARAARLEAQQKNPKLVAAEDRRAQRGARLAAHASREWTGVLEDVPESPPRIGPGQLADEQPANHADRAFPEPPTRLPVPPPPVVLFKQNPSAFEAVPSIPADLAAKVQTANLERTVENSPYSGDAVFSEDSPQSITADFFTPTRAPAQKEVVTANTIAFIDGEQSMLERFETFLKRSERAEDVVVVGQEVVIYESPKAEEHAYMDEEQSMCVRLESFLTAMMEENGFSSYSPYVEGAAVEKRTRCFCL